MDKVIEYVCTTLLCVAMFLAFCFLIAAGWVMTEKIIHLLRGIL